MTFDKWEKEHSAEFCPHCIKGQGITVTRCRQCVWEAAQKEEIDNQMRVIDALQKSHAKSDSEKLQICQLQKEQAYNEALMKSNKLHKQTAKLISEINRKKAAILTIPDLKKRLKEAKLDGKLEAIAEKEKEDKNWYMQGRKELAKEAYKMMQKKEICDDFCVFESWLEKEANKP